MSTSASAREIYVDNLDRLLWLEEQLGPKLSAMEIASSSAEKMISEARESLASKLTGTNTASTVGYGLSIVGGVLVLTPFALVGAGLIGVGSLTAAGSSVAKSFFFEKDAATAFTQAFNKYNTTSHDIRELSERTEECYEQLAASLALFMSTLQAEILSTPSGPENTPSNPGIPTPGGVSSFSLAALQGVASGGSIAKPWLGAGTKSAAQLADWLGK